MKNTARNSAFEAMRLLAMFMIVLEHCMGGSRSTGNPLSTLDNISWFIFAFTICAVDLFFLLTGYFATSKPCNIKKLAHTWGKTIFYSVSIYLATVILFGDTIDIKAGIKYLFPIFTCKYWFMQVYIVLLLLMPYIMTMIEALTKKQHLMLIGILVLFFSLHQTFIPVRTTLDSTQGYGIIWAVVMLVIGSFLRKYGNEVIGKIPAGAFLAGYIFVACCMFVSNVLIVKFNIAQGLKSRENFYAYNSISVLVETLFLFCFFIRISMKGWSSRIINRISACALSVYLIASHPVMLSSMWTKILNVNMYLDSIPKYIAVSVISSIVTMIACIAIDMVVEMIIGVIGRCLRKDRG